MSGRSGNVRVSITGDPSGLDRATRQAEGYIGRLGSRVEQAGQRMADTGDRWTRGVTLPLLAGGVVAGKMAIDFSDAMQQISTQAGASQKEVTRMTEAVLDFAASGRTDEGPTALAKGLFRLESAGLRGEKAMTALRRSEELASVGHVELEQSTTVLSAALKTGIKDTENLGKTVGILNATVGAGNMRFEDLTAALGTGILPKAKMAGLSLRDVGAAIATMTAQGIPATSAATQLGMTFAKMQAPTAAAKDAMKSIGLESTSLARSMQSGQGLAATIGILQDHLSGLSKVQQQVVISDMFGGGRTSGGIKLLLGSLEDLEQRYEGITKNAGLFDQKLKETDEQAAEKLGAGLAQAETALVKLGSAAVPVVVPALQDVADIASDVSETFDGLSPSTKEFTVKAVLLTAALGPVLSIGGRLVKTYGGLLRLMGRLGPATAAASAGATATQAAPAAAGAGTTGGVIASARSGAAGMRSTYDLARSFGRGRLASMAAAGFATSFAAGLAPAIAAVGIGNVVTSAIDGDMREAGFKGGGALAGGIAGAFFGPAGAMIGAGLGSFAGGLAEDAFGAIFDSGKKLSPLQEQLAASSERLADAMAAERLAVRGLGAAANAEVGARKRQRQAAERVEQAERGLLQTRRQHKAGSLPIVRAEVALMRARREEAKATRESQNAEKRHGFELKLARVSIRAAALETRHRINVLKREREEIRKQGQALAEYGGSEEEIEKWQRRNSRNARDLTKAHGAYARVLQDASSQVGAKFAKNLERASGDQLRFAESVQRSGGSVKQSSREFREAVFGFAQYSERSAGKVESAGKRMADAPKRVRDSAKRNLAEAGGAYKDAAGAAGGALGSMGSRTQSFLQAVGAKGVDFDFRAKGGAVRRPMAIVGEEAPQHHEWVIATNPRYRRDNLGYWMQAGRDLGVPGFAKGGLHKPRITGPEQLRSVAQAPVDRAHRAAQAFIDARRPKAGAGGVAGYTGPPASMKQLGDNAWVDSHTLAVGAFLAKKFGLSISSGYRDPAHNAAVGGVLNSSHTRGSSSNPGALDFVPPSSAALAWSKRHIAGLMEAMIHDAGSGLHLHLAFFRKGGKIDWSDLVGSSWDNNELATLAHVVGMKSPGLMAQIAQGESGGNARAVGQDPGGTEGLGLWQITTGYNDELIAKYGGRDAMFNPLMNARAAKEILDSNGLDAWYAPPTGPRGEVDKSLAEKLRALIGGKSVDPDQVPVHGRTKLSFDEKISRADTRIAKAGTTATLKDDRRAAVAKLDILRSRKRYLEKQVRGINKKLQGELKPPVRDRLLEKREAFLSELGSMPDEASSLVESLREAGVGPKRLKKYARGFGIGTADPNAEKVTARDRADLQLARAEMTPGKDDDLAALEKLVDVSKQELKVAKKSGDPRKVAEATRNLKEATDNLREALPTAHDFASRDLALAELTEGTEDDRAALLKLQEIAQQELDAALATDDPRDDIEAAQNLKSVNESLKALDETIAQQNQLMEEQKQFAEERLATDKRLADLAEKQGPAFFAALLANIDGAIGGPVDRREGIPTAGVQAGYA